MKEEYTSLGLMSGTSGDGVDASIIRSDGCTEYKAIKDKYFQYDKEIQQNIHYLKEKICSIKDLSTFVNELSGLERQITLFHAEVVKEISINQRVDVIGFHGQTIYHNPKEKTSNQIGDGKLLSQLTKQDIVYDFRTNDIKGGGEGAPLTPIFHQLIADKYKLDLPICFLNIGGISNITIVEELGKSDNLTSKDIGPGNCLIDTWVRKNSNQNFDQDGLLASKGIRDVIIFEQAQELFSNRLNQDTSTFDINDFDVSFARGLSLENGAATLTEFTAKIISVALLSLKTKLKKKIKKILVCGGGRKNRILINNIKQDISKDLIIEPIDKYGIDGDFVESQAFAFLAIRSILKLPISFPGTTGCKISSIGGKIIRAK